jgi:hypothetical protein
MEVLLTKVKTVYQRLLEGNDQTKKKKDKRTEGKMYKWRGEKL